MSWVDHHPPVESARTIVNTPFGSLHRTRDVSFPEGPVFALSERPVWAPIAPRPHRQAASRCRWYFCVTEYGPLHHSKPQPHTESGQKKIAAPRGRLALGGLLFPPERFESLTPSPRAQCLFNEKPSSHWKKPLPPAEFPLETGASEHLSTTTGRPKRVL
jgi:hypothetical protein